uniref:trem-like transcript 4 protein n=1 Tax=Jaculus jaculus TaxID=51337 RepID=UPI001E1B0295|nr:trem-like transcript 4 protein [Jaculus jaculus]
MAGKATNLLAFVALEMLAAGCWAQRTKVLRALEGRSISTTCSYAPTQVRMVKSWCVKISGQYCDILVNSLGTRWPRFTLQDYPKQNFFNVTMTALREQDTGFYHCGVSEVRSVILILQTFQLLVAKASTPTTTSSARLTTTGASGTSLVIDSSSDNRTWKFIVAGVTVAVLLLLGLAILVALYLRKVRGRAEKGMNGSRHVYEDVAGQAVVSTGFHQKKISGVDTGAIHYASLIHLNHLDLQHSIDTNNQPNPKPTHDPLLSVEYARINTNSSSPPKLAAPEAECRNRGQSSQDSEHMGTSFEE